VRAAAASLGRFIVSAARRKPQAALLPDRMAEGLARFGGLVLLLLSGNDLTAREFADVAAGSARWQNLLAQRGVTRMDLAEANHTFSRAEWRDEVARCTAKWVRAL
jgi:hypothetical protein